MKLIKLHISTGYAGAEHLDFINVPEEGGVLPEQQHRIQRLGGGLGV
jgi:hypothetical protein